jgi:hypothetical protein
VAGRSTSTRGQVTRSHDDVDLAVWLEDVQRIESVLLQTGWRHAPQQDEDGGTGYERGAVRLELTFLVRDADGRASIPLRDGLVPWPADALADERRELHGVRARVVALAPILQGKSTPRDDPADAVKDCRDAAVLERLGGVG